MIDRYCLWALASTSTPFCTLCAQITGAGELKTTYPRLLAAEIWMQFSSCQGDACEQYTEDRRGREHLSCSTDGWVLSLDSIWTPCFGLGGRPHGGHSFLTVDPSAQSAPGRQADCTKLGSLNLNVSQQCLKRGKREGLGRV